MKRILFFFLILPISFGITNARKSDFGWPTGEIHVDVNGKEGVQSIGKAVILAKNDGDLIVIHPGIYAEAGLEFDAAVSVIASGDVTWTGDSTLFKLNVDGVKFQGTVKDGFKLYCTHPSAVVFDPNGKDYEMCDIIIEGKDILLSEPGVNALVNRIKLYPEGAAGARITGGYFLSEGDFQINEPVNIAIPDSGFGLNVSSGLGHFRGKTNIYVGVSRGDSMYVAIDECIEISGDRAMVVLYASAICGIRGPGDFNAIKVSDGTFACYGGEFANNSGVYPTIYFAQQSNGGYLRYCYIQNRGQTYAFASHDSAGSASADSIQVINCIMKGGQPGTTAFFGAKTYETENVDLKP